MANESTKWLYEQLTTQGYNVGKDLQEFEGLMQSNEESRKWAYDTASKSGLNVGKDIDEFTSLVAPAPAQPQTALQTTADQPQTPIAEVQPVQSQVADATTTPAPTQEVEQTAPAPVAPAPKFNEGNVISRDGKDYLFKGYDEQGNAMLQPEGQTNTVVMQPQMLNNATLVSEKAWQPTEKQKIEASYNINKMLNDFNEASKARIEQSKRIAERNTPEGRQKQKAGEMQARMAGTPASVDMGSAQEGSPVPYGVTYENGEAKTQWLLPDGSLTTDLAEAYSAEDKARAERLQGQFIQRMKSNGLDPEKQEDVERQATLDLQQPAYDAVAELWDEAERLHKEDRNKNAKKEWGDYAMMGGGREMRMVTAGSNRHKDTVSHMTRFDIEKMMNKAWDKAGSKISATVYDNLRRSNPEADEAELKAQADEIARQLTDNAVYEYAVKQNTPKSTLEFFGRTVADMNLINSIGRGLARSEAGTAGDLAAYEQAMAEYGKKHKVAQVAGTVVGMAVDPTTWISGGVGSISSKGALNLGSRFMMKEASREAAKRAFGSTLTGRIIAGTAGAAGNLATYEGMKEGERQWMYGGHINPETGENEGYSPTEILKSSGHGAVMGSIIGPLSPVIGNVADKTVKLTNSTGGKLLVRGGEVAISTLAEGTVFSIPQWIEGEEDAFDVWTDNMAMMLGFKAQHGIKSVPQVIQSLRPIKPTDGRPLTQAERNHNRMDFMERLRNSLDGNKTDLSFTEEERDELRRNGYGELGDLFTNDSKKSNHSVKREKGDNATAIDFQTADSETIHTSPDFEGYSEMEALMSDPKVSEATKAKAYYILTGRMLPMSTIVGYNESTTKDENGKETTYVESVNADGGVVTSRKFTNRKDAEREMDAIARQAELNSIDIGERYKETEADDMVLNAAINEVSPGADLNTVKRIYQEVKNGGKVSESQRELVEFIDEAIERNKDIANDSRPEAIRNRIKEETGIDVDKALKKSRRERTEEETQALETYAKELFPERQEPETSATPEQEAAQNIYEETKLLPGRYFDEQAQQPQDPNNPVPPSAGEAKAEMDAIVYRMQEAYQLVDDVFGDEADIYRSQLEDDPFTLANDPTLTPDQRDAVLNYINSKAALNGVMDGANEAAQNKMDIARQEIDHRTNKDSGMVQPAVMKMDDKPVYIVKGNVSMFPDGSDVDRANSSDSLIILDPADPTGEYKWASVDEIYKVDEPIDPQVQLAEVQRTIEEEQAAIFSGFEEGNIEGVGDVEGIGGVPENADLGTSNVPNVPENVPNDTQNVPNVAENVPEPTESVPSWQSILDLFEGNKEEATSIVNAQIEQAQKAIADLQKKEPKYKQPKLSGTPQQMKEAMRSAQAEHKALHDAWQAEVDTQQTILDQWNAVKTEADNIALAEQAALRAEQEEKNRIAHEQAVAEFEEQKKIKAEKEAGQAEVGTHAVNPKIKEKWDNANKITGNADEITLADGSTLRGHYVLAEAGAATPSHDVNNAYSPTEGFPIDANGQSVNDRDYQRDSDAQRIVEDIAGAYDNRALQTPVIVSKDGVVLSGNNRTMSGELAAKQGTDKAYNDYLKEFGAKYGFAPEVVEGFSNPRLVFVPDENMPYDATTFSRFNAQEMKSQSKPEAVVKLGKVVPDNIFHNIVDDISRYDRLSEFYADEKAVAQALGQLLQAGVINDKQMPELRTGTALSAGGKELIENTLIGKVFQSNPDAVRQIISIPTLRQSVVMGLSEIASNRKLAKQGYDLSDELAKAVDLVQRAKTAMPDIYTDGMPVSPFGRQAGLFDDEFGESMVKDATTLLLADILNSGRPSDLRKVLATYNAEASQSAAGQIDMFTGDIATKEDILTQVNEHFRNATPKEQQALVDAAIAERKRQAENRAAEQSGRDEGSEQTENALAGQTEAEGRRNAKQLSANDRGRSIPDTPATDEIKDSEETDENGTPYILSSNGTTEISQLKDKNGKELGAIRVSRGFDRINPNGEHVGYGYEHLDAKHGASIKKAGYRNSLEFIEDIANNHQGVKEGGKRKNGKPTYIIEHTDKSGNILYIELTSDDKSWIVNSGGIFRKDYLKNKKSIETLPAVESSPVAADEEVQERGDSPMSGDSPSTDFSEVLSSNSEDNAFLSEEQAKSEKSSANGGVIAEEKPKDIFEEAERIAKRSKLKRDISRAERDVNTNPTEAQKEAGNYKKGHVQIGTFDVTIENPKGSVRSGKDQDGKEWSVTMQHTYGYIRGTKGVDGDHIDVYASSDIDGWNGRKVFVIDQYNPDGTFDEHKVMLGFNDKEEAYDAYLSNYEKGWENGRRIDISSTNIEDFEKWIDSSKRKTKPFAEYKTVKKEKAVDQFQYFTEPLNRLIRIAKEKTQGLVKKILSPVSSRLQADLLIRGIEIDDTYKHVIDNYAINHALKKHGGETERKRGQIPLEDKDFENIEEVVTDYDSITIDRNGSKEIIKYQKTYPDGTTYYVEEVRSGRKELAMVTMYKHKNTNRTDENLKEPTSHTPKATSDLIGVSESKDSENLEDRQIEERKVSAIITPTTYTNKKGKTSDISLVKFSRDLTYEEREAAKSLISEPLSAGKKTPKGWYDRNEGGYMMRSEEAAKELVSLIDNPDGTDNYDKISDNQPLSREDLKRAIEPKKEPEPKKPANEISIEEIVNGLEPQATIIEDIVETTPQGKSLNITEDMKKDEDILRDLLGIGEDEVDGNVHYRLDELTPEQRRKVYAAGVNYSMGYIEQGLVRFEDFALAMSNRLGEKIKPWLKSFYEGVKRMPGYEDIDFTPTDEVDKFDIDSIGKPSDIFQRAETKVEERKVEKATKEAEKELIAERNEQRKQEDEQTTTNTKALEAEAKSVGKEADTLAKTSTDEREINAGINKIDDTLNKINEQLALLGYYEMEEDDSKFHESYGYMLTAEKKAVDDATKLAKQLVKDLGIELDKVTGKTTLSKNKKETAVSANIAPAGGDVTITLPLNEGRQLKIYIGLDPIAEKGSRKSGDNLGVERILYRIENPSNGGLERYESSNHYMPEGVTYNDFLRRIKEISKKYLPKEAEAVKPVEQGSKSESKPKASMIKKTPIMQLFEQMKEKHPDAIILIKVGDFFETFNQDAVDASRILGITLTRRANGKNEAVELAGFPYHALDSYLPKLVRAGRRVAVCEQLEDPKLTKKLAKRPSPTDTPQPKEEVSTEDATQQTLEALEKYDRKKEKKAVKSDTKIGSLFNFEEESIPSKQETPKEKKDGKRTEIQSGRTDTGRSEERQQPRQDEPLGAGTRNELEQSKPGRVAGSDTAYTGIDETGSRAVSGGTQPTELAIEDSNKPKKNTRNFSLKRGEQIAPLSESSRIKANIAAIEKLQELIDSGRQATPEEMKILSQYSGWGGLGSAFNERGGYSSYTTAKRLKELLGEEGFQDALKSTRSAFYTPAEVINPLWDLAKALGFKGGKILEGSAGIGNMLALMPKDIAERSDIHAVEIDPTTGGILAQLYPDAQVDIQGFEKTRIPNNSVDLAITNVPFVTGLRVTDDSGDKDLSRRFGNIHDFAMAKNVRKLKPGGLGIFITSAGTLDGSRDFRKWLVNEGSADVIGAFRLNNKTFGGTNVTSDIIIVRKRINGRISSAAIDVSETIPVRTAHYSPGRYGESAKDVSMSYNRYFVEHPEHMAGEMQFNFENGESFRATSTGLFPKGDKPQKELLEAWANDLKDRLDKANKEERETPGYISTAQEQKADNRKREESGAKEGALVLNSDGKLAVVENGEAVELGVNSNKVKGHTKVEVYNDYTAIKKALDDLLAYQTENDGETPELMAKIADLNKAYDSFVNKYGHFYKNNQLAWLRNDVDYPSVSALEIVKESADKKGNKVIRFGKTDIFSRRVIEKEKTPQPQNVRDGVITSISLFGTLDIDYIAKALGKDVEEVKREIIETGLGFENPEDTNIEVSYQYLSGNVRDKLEIAKSNNDGGKYDRNIQALEKVKPLDIPAHLIEFSLGSTWLPSKVYDQYVKEKTGIDITFNPVGGTWVANKPYWTDTEPNKAAGIYSKVIEKWYTGSDIIEAAMKNKTLEFKKTIKNRDGSTETITDPEATAAVGAKADEYRQDFKDWLKGKLQEDTEFSNEIAEKYNYQFNNYVPLTIPDEFVPQRFPGSVTSMGGVPFALRPHQSRAVIKASTEPVLFAHEVGTGKTFTLITSAMEMRRLGLAQKPMIVVQNATLGQFVESAKQLYPNARILTLTDKDRTKDGRLGFYAKIKYNDWDMIVVPQSVFDMIPDSPQREAQYISEKIEEKRMVLDRLIEAADGRDPMVRRAQKELEDLENQLVAITESQNKGGDSVAKQKKRLTALENAETRAKEMLDRKTDAVENFDDMGIDAILVDESHEYKHLGFSTAMQRGVKGVDPSYSKKAQGLYLKTQSVRDRKGNRNIVFATGTPISNTAAEVWTFMRYLMPEEMMKDYDIYYFDDFVRNFGSLQQMLEFTTSGKFKENNRFAGYTNLPELARLWSSVADIVLTSEAGEVKSKIPEMEEEKAQDIYLPQTQELRSVMKYVKAELQRFEEMTGAEKRQNSHIPLTMYGIANAAAIDPRLVKDGAVDEPNSKTNEAVRQTLRALKDSEKYKGTVAIFSDKYQNQRSGFNLYEDIKKKLVAKGIPEDKIAIMKPGMKIEAKQKLFDKVNNGEVRVILGSTQTLGTGVNIQERLFALIHLDAPNRPMDYWQRMGRILRQGNLFKEWGIPVRVLRFGVEDSLDVTAYQRLKTKGAIADSIMHSKDLLSNAMENRTMEEEEDVFGDTIAQLSGSEYAMLKTQAEKQVRKLEGQRKSWQADQMYVSRKIPQIKKEIGKQKEGLEKVDKGLQEVLKRFPDGHIHEIKIGDATYSDITDMADFLKEYNKTIKEAQNQVRGTAEGNKITRQLTVNADGVDFIFTTEIESGTRKGEDGGLFAAAITKMSYSCPELWIENHHVDQALLRNGIEDIKYVASSYGFVRGRDLFKHRIEELENELKVLEPRLGQPFKYEQELADATARLEEYTEKMKAELEAKEAKYADMDKDIKAAEDIHLDEDSETSGDGNKYRLVEEEIAEANEMFNTQLENYSRGELKASDVLFLGNPMGIMQFFMPDLEMILRQSVIKKALKKHGLRIEDLRNLPGAIATPIFLFQRDSGTLSLLTELLGSDKNNLFVAIDLDKERQIGKRFINVNDLLTIHGRDADNVVLPIIENNSLVWVDKEKGLEWLSSASQKYQQETANQDQKGGLSSSELNPQAIAPISEGAHSAKSNSQAITLETFEDAAKVVKDFDNNKWRENKPETSPEAKTAKIEELSNKLNTPIRIINDVDTPGERPLSARERRAKGWYDTDNNEVVIVEPNNVNVADVENTIVHEVVGHKGLRAMVGEERMNEFVDEVYNHASDKIKSTIDQTTQRMVNAEADRLAQKEIDGKEEVPTGFFRDAYREKHRPEAERKREKFRREATEEFMSDMAGRIGDEGFEKMSREEQTLWGRIKAKVQQFLDKFLKRLNIPKGIRLTDKDIAYILYKSWKNMRDIFDRAEDVNMRRKTGYDADDAKRFRDPDMGLEETITKMKAEAMQANADNLQAKRDAMRAIGGNLNHLRSAMARQREYDITTVKSITDLAKVLMDNNLLDDLSKTETKRILGAVNNVVGRQDVSKYVQKVMDIMVDNQLRLGTKTFSDLVTIKGSRVDARGIEVQGILDPDGQRMAQVVKKSISLPKDDIENRIAEALNRMGSTDQATADEAAIEYSGLQVALRYVEEIKGSKAEEKDLRESLKQAKEDKDAGQMTEAAYKQYVQATEDAIRQNKIERAEAYQSLIEAMSDILGESVERAKAWKEAEIERVKAIQHNANSDMEGRPTDEHHKNDRVQKIANNSGVRFLLAPLGTFDQMLRMFGKKNAKGEGYLWNRYMRGWVDATEKEYTGYRDSLKILDNKVSEVFGKKMSWGDLFTIDRKLPKGSVTFWDGGEMKEHELTQGNLLYIYMADKMSDGRMKLRRMGITEEDIEDIKNFLDPRFIELADWMQDEFLTDKRNEYNEVHKRMFGASMAAIENYFPLKILANARLENVDVADDTTDPALPATTTGSIIKRRRNNLALDVTGANAFSVILDHLQQMERWAAFAEFNRDLNTLLSYKRFRNQVMNMSSAYGAGKTLWNNFRNVCRMAAGAYRPPIAALDKAAVNIAKGVTAAKVSFRVFTALKQFLSMPAYVSDSNPMYLARNIVDPVGAWKWSMENLPIFDKRWKSRMAGDPRLMKSEMDWKAWRSNVVQIASRIGMSPNAFVDALTVSIGAHSMYQTKLAKYLRQGYDRSAAEKRAKQDATILFNQTQQSSEGAFLSTMQVDRSWLSVLFTVFRNSSMSYTRQLYDAIRNLKGRVTGDKELSTEFMAKQLLRAQKPEEEGNWSDEDWTKARKHAGQEYRNTILRDLVKVGIFGYVLQMAWNLGAYLPYLILGEDEDEKSKMWDDVLNHSMFGAVEGFTGGDVMSSAGEMALSGEANWSYLVKDMPLASDLSAILKKMPKDQASAMNDVVNLLVQSGIGVNPQSLTDAVVAIIDACGEDAQSQRECALLITRVLNCPQSQIDKIYFDELGLTGTEASKMTPAELAERYADYKIKREAPMTGWMRSQETEDSIKEAKQKKVLNIAKDKITGRMATEATQRLLSEYDEVTKKETELNKLKKTDREAFKEGRREIRDNYDLRILNRVKRYKRDIKELTEQYLRSKSPEECDSLVERMYIVREKMLEDVVKHNR